MEKKSVNRIQNFMYDEQMCAFFPVKIELLLLSYT